MKTKIAIAMLIGVTSVAAVFYWREYSLPLPKPPENPTAQEVVIESISYYDKDFTSLLPDCTLMVVGANSPCKLLEQLKLAQYSNLAETLREKSEKIGFDIGDGNAWQQRGIDTGKPFGLAIIELQSTRLSTNPVIAVFIGVADKDKFLLLLQQRFASANLQLLEKSIENTACTLVQQNGKTAGVYCFKSGYWMFYIDATRMAVEEKFTKRMLSPSRRLSTSRNFQQCIQRIDKGQGYFFIDTKRATNTIKQHNYSIGDMVESLAPRKMRGIAAAFCVNKNTLTISGYLHASKKSVDDWKNPSSSASILARFPKNPLLCASCNLDIAGKWQGARNSIDQLLPLAIQSLQPHMKPDTQMLPNTVGEAIQKLESAIEEKLKKHIDIEKTLIPKIQGNVALAVYQLNRQSAVNAVLAIRLKSSQKIKEIIAGLAATDPTIKTTQGIFYKFEVRENFALTAGVIDNWLLLCTKSETCREILEKPGNMTGKLQDREIAKSMEDGDPLAIYFDLARLNMEHFNKFTWRVWLGEKGIHTRISLQCNQQILDILNDLDKMQKNSDITSPLPLPGEK